MLWVNILGCVPKCFSLFKDNSGIALELQELCFQRHNILEHFGIPKKKMEQRNVDRAELKVGIFLNIPELHLLHLY